MSCPLIIFEYIAVLGLLLFYFFIAFPKIPINNDDPASVRDGRLLKVGIIFATIVIFNIVLKVSTDNFMFQLTPEKKCDGGPYMYSSDPARQALCSKFSQEQLSRYECPGGLYNGRPVWWDGATNGTLSNANWQNDTCNQISKDYNDPQVL